MSTTANIGLEILTEGQANKEASISESHQQLDALVQAGVIDRDLTAPPGSPAEGDVYLIPTGSPAASGAWAGQDGDIAHYRNSAWTFITPKEGWRLYVKDEDLLIVYDGSTWYAVGGSIRVKEADSSPDVNGVTTMVVPNGSLTDDGGGQVTLNLSAALAGFQGIWEQIDRVEFSGVSSVTVGGAQTPSDYDAYLLLILNASVAGDTVINLLASSSGGSPKITNYTRVGGFHRSNNTHGNFGGTTDTELPSSNVDASVANKNHNRLVWLLAPGSSDHKMGFMERGAPDASSGINLVSGSETFWVEDTAAIDSFVLDGVSNNITGTVVLIGLKKSETAGRVVTDGTTARTLSEDDNNRIIDFNGSASPAGATVTIPDTLSQGFACKIWNRTGGSISISAGGSPAITIVGDTSVSNGQGAEIWMLDTNVAAVSAL